MNTKTTFGVVLATALLAVCSLFAGATVAAPVTQHVTVSGYVSCTTCLMPNACKAQTRLSCTEMWISQGAAYVLVTENTHYRLSGFDKELAKAAAENSVTITGDLDGRDLTVTAVNIGTSKK